MKKKLISMQVLFLAIILCFTLSVVSASDGGKELEENKQENTTTEASGTTSMSKSSEDITPTSTSATTTETKQTTTTETTEATSDDEKTEETKTITIYYCSTIDADHQVKPQVVVLTYKKGETYDISSYVHENIEFCTWDSCDTPETGTVEDDMVVHVYYTEDDIVCGYPGEQYGEASETEEYSESTKYDVPKDESSKNATKTSTNQKSSQTTNVVATGDGTVVYLYIAMGCVACLIGGTILYKKRKNL